MLIEDNSEILIPQRDESRILLGMLEMPAYMRRAVRVESAIETLLKRCQRERKEMLHGVKLRLREWNTLVKRDPSLMSLQSPESQQAIESLNSHLFDGEPAQLEGWAKPGRPPVVWRELQGSIDRFNQKWTGFTDSLDLSKVNQEITDYNRFYLVEKECAFRSARLAARGYKPLQLISPQSLRKRYPLLPTPQGASG